MLQYLKRLNNLLGPGLTVGAAGDDPSSLGVYTQAGARFGFTMLWTAPLSYPFLAVIQEICGRIGIVTGKGLGFVTGASDDNPLGIGSNIFFAVYECCPRNVRQNRFNFRKKFSQTY